MACIQYVRIESYPFWAYFNPILEINSPSYPNCLMVWECQDSHRQDPIKILNLRHHNLLLNTNLSQIQTAHFRPKNERICLFTT